MLQSQSQNSSSSTSFHATPPKVKTPYLPKEALEDISGISYALNLFLASKMVESENYCSEQDRKMERLYFATGYSLIQCVKGLMSFEDDDLLAALDHSKHGNAIAQKHRKKSASVASKLAGYVIPSLGTTGIGFIKSMTPTELHAELIYAETLFQKALLGIVYSGDWLAFIKEALNMRTTIAIYNGLGKFIEVMDAEAVQRGEGPEDKSIDVHFRSGVHLGVGTSNLILSLMPGKVMTLVELFGYRGDRRRGLELLYKVGGWTKDSPEPSVCAEDEGLRRSISDMQILIFHLVLSNFTFDGVDVHMAQRVLDWNLKRYPTGVFYLFGAGRLNLIRNQPQRAIEYYTKAIEIQSQYRNLHHISFWEIAIANMSLWDVSASLACWRDLQAEASWSKAMYTYGMAICLLELKDDEKKKEAIRLMEKVPSLRQKIAGKSIPIEKFVARKARKFKDQGNRLALPGLEMAYLLLAIAHAPRSIVLSKMLPEIERTQAKLKACADEPKSYEGGKGYWDDYCLSRFLEGVCCRYFAFPDPDAVLDPNETFTLSKEEAGKRAVAAFESVFVNGPKIELDHYLVFHAHYELGRLLACQGNVEGGRKHLDMVLSGKPLEVNAAGRKGKYSMEGALQLRTHAIVETLQGSS